MIQEALEKGKSIFESDSIAVIVSSIAQQWLMSVGLEGSAIDAADIVTLLNKTYPGKFSYEEDENYSPEDEEFEDDEPEEEYEEEEES